MGTQQSRFIFGSLKRDIAYLVLPGVLALALLLPSNEASPVFGFFALILFISFDSGHSMLTFVRMSILKGEWKASPRTYIMPLLIFLIIVTWVRAEMPYLITFVILYSAYHYMRQHWGILRWYETLAKDRFQLRKLFLYTSFALPFIASYFRDPNIKSLYNDKDMLFLPNAALFTALNLLAAFVFLTWIAVEVRRHKMHPNLGIWVAVMQLAVHITANFLGTTTLQVFGPLLTMHAVSYFILTRKLYEANELKNNDWKWVASIVVAIAVLAAPLSLLESYTHQSDLYVWYKAILLGIVLTPGLVHYHFDSFLWSQSQSNFAKVFRT